MLITYHIKFVEKVYTQVLSQLFLQNREVLIVITYIF